jgi:DNA replication protein DnaC
VNTISYSQEIKKAVSDIYEAKHRQAIGAANARKRELYSKIAGLEEIDLELSKTGLKIYHEAINKHTEEPLEARIAKLRAENEKLQKTRAELLVMHGYDKDYTSPDFECKKCSDTGYVGIEPCECVYKALKKEAFIHSGLGMQLTEQTFDNFDVSLYPEKDREVMSLVLNEAIKYAENFGNSEFSEDKNLLFFGGTGLGKTHLTTAIGKRLIDRGFYVVYDSATNIISNFEKNRFSKATDCDKYFECDVLMLDDLGAETFGSFNRMSVYDIINTRLNMNKGTVISTNYQSIPEMKKAYDERIVSRIAGNYRMFRFSGDDIRVVKKLKRQ